MGLVLGCVWNGEPEAVPVRLCAEGAAGFVKVDRVKLPHDGAFPVCRSHVVEAVLWARETYGEHNVSVLTEGGGPWVLRV